MTRTNQSLHIVGSYAQTITTTVKIQSYDHEGEKNFDILDGTCLVDSGKTMEEAIEKAKALISRKMNTNITDCFHE